MRVFTTSVGLGVGHGFSALLTGAVAKPLRIYLVSSAMFLRAPPSLFSRIRCIPQLQQKEFASKNCENWNITCLYIVGPGACSASSHPPYFGRLNQPAHHPAVPRNHGSRSASPRHRRRRRGRHRRQREEAAGADLRDGRTDPHGKGDDA